ncbi:unnamed protein product [Dibothriocephalus latus]|uniref:Uncharacterized protein n=1 Tax=Dibothriocephalus latus TaxID=60516 RepID=A0A3P7M7L7_DIBLA|nr:unnamed protein product [Dibothriocephalus latus]
MGINRLEDLQASEDIIIGTRFCKLRDIIYSIALDFLGGVGLQHQDWFDDKHAGICNLLTVNNRLQKAYIERRTDNNKADVAAWCSNVCGSCRMPERLAKPMKYRDALTTTKRRTFSSQSRLPTASLLGSDGTELMTKKTKKVKCLAERIGSVPNHPCTISEADIDRLP